MNNKSVKIAIPATGRMTEKMLRLLGSLGIVKRDWAEDAAYAIGTVKKNGSEDEVRAALVSKWEDGIEGLTMNYDLRSGWRLAFSATETEVAGIPVVVYGSEPPTINGIRQGLAEVAVIGYDDLLAAMVPFLRRDFAKANEPISPGWRMMDLLLRDRKLTDVTVLCPTGLMDYAGLFMLASASKPVSEDYLTAVVEGRTPVFVKGRYEGLAYYLLGTNVDTRATEDIEDAVKSAEGFGLDIVQTGATVAEKSLQVVGEPLLVTRSLITVDGAKYNRSLQLKAVVKALSYEYDRRVKPRLAQEDEEIRNWKSSLEQKLGGLWVMREAPAKTI